MRNIRYSTYENIFTLHSFKSVRDFKLNRLGDTTNRPLTKNLREVIKENYETDRELFSYFTDRSRYTPESHELHLDRCLDSGVRECTCMEHPERPSALQEEVL